MTGGRPLKYPFADLAIDGTADIRLHSRPDLRRYQIRSLRVAAVRYGRRHGKGFSVSLNNGIATIRRTK